jgi:hypothetical protein
MIKRGRAFYFEATLFPQVFHSFLFLTSMLVEYLFYQANPRVQTFA